MTRLCFTAPSTLIGQFLRHFKITTTRAYKNPFPFFQKKIKNPMSMANKTMGTSTNSENLASRSPEASKSVPAITPSNVMNDLSVALANANISSPSSSQGRFPGNSEPRGDEPLQTFHPFPRLPTERKCPLFTLYQGTNTFSLAQGKLTIYPQSASKSGPSPSDPPNVSTQSQSPSHPHPPPTCPSNSRSTIQLQHQHQPLHQTT
ncbi:hypothetical protein DL98DRAFT_257881 [Cadophora sp. DSE1049]|nr:hypothetical protein DL98DRAFT_257881 [Cadophora sp. DSE1049]